ncbi:hypothetical protein [Dactylosporangium sp. NPDC005555]|uniref:hypothetical protein n=1 Tax=Dactylosporangium sp. NPDC005555 TaxID=3154889 RepID=UPI0033AA19E7
MSLHYRRPNFLLLGLSFLAGVVIIWLSLTGSGLTVLFIPLGSTALFVLGVLPILFSLWSVRQAFRPEPVVIEQGGLRLRVAGIDRAVPWAAIDAVFLEPYVNPGDDSHTLRLVVVPAAGADLGVVAEYRNRTDGRPSIILLALDEILEPPADVARSLATYAGPKYAAAA